MDNDHDFSFPLLDERRGDLHEAPLVDEGESNTWLLDNVELNTVGVDVGSSTSHLVFSRLHMQRLAQSLSSRFVVVERTELYRSPILLTPFTSEGTIDTEVLANFIEQSYSRAGIEPSIVDTGVVILTGVALERKNARAVAELFAAHGGKFVCASAGHNLEGLLAAHGSGAVALSRRTGKEVLHIDIGGGTSKLALIRDGEILKTSAISIGARLLAFDGLDRPVRVEKAALTIAKEIDLEIDTFTAITEAEKIRFSKTMASALFAHAFGEPLAALTKELLLTPALDCRPAQDCLVTFSGGVSEYLLERESQSFNDLALPLADAIKSEMVSRGLTITPSGEGIRATAIGASQFTVQLSGNTILVSDGTTLPVHNIPVVCPKLTERPNRTAVAKSIEAALARLDIDCLTGPICVYLPWKGDAEYSVLFALASGVKDALQPLVAKDSFTIVLALEVDLGAALGRILREELGLASPLISIDGVDLRELDFIDIGEPLQPTKVLPVMVKSLAFPLTTR